MAPLNLFLLGTGPYKGLSYSHSSPMSGLYCLLSTLLEIVTWQPHPPTLTCIQQAAGRGTNSLDDGSGCLTWSHEDSGEGHSE